MKRIAPGVFIRRNIDCALHSLHGDHVNGLIAADGSRVFPKADIWSAKADSDFWLSEEVAANAPKDSQAFFKMARDAAAPYQREGVWKTFERDQEILPGIASVAAHGHTPGSAYLLRSGDQSLLIWRDLVHNHAVQFARPGVAIEFDIDKKKAVAARSKALFARAASEKLLVGGMHLPFPGVDHVRREPRGYAWVPVEYGPVREDVK